MQGHKLAIGAAAVAVVLALAGAAFAALAGHAKTARTSIAVTEREYHITLSKKTVGSGTVVLTVHNAGHLAHELAVAGGGLHGTARLPAIAPGKTRTLTLSLTRGGTVKVWCPLPGHAALGMSTAFKVTGASAAAPVPPPSTTTTGGSDAWG